MHSRPLITTALAVLAATTIAARPAAAQAGLSLGGSVGANLPQGNFGDGAATGLVANGFVQLGGGGFGLRGELFWSRSDLDSPVIRRVGNVVLPSSGVGNVDGNVNLIGGIASLVVPLMPGPVQPYLIGGIGTYHRRVAQNIGGTFDEFKDLRHTDNDVGYSGGAGIRLSVLGHGLFVEGRYHSVKTSPEKTTFIPVTVGFTF
jgi:outer membrane protein with beta-barrel domain